MIRQREDYLEDILRKAIKGQGLTDTQLMAASGLSMIEIEAARDGHCSHSALRALAQALDLDPDKLIRIADNPSLPEPPLPGELIPFTSAFPNVDNPTMLTNAFLVQSGNKEAILFDTGADADAVAGYCHAHELTLRCCLLTHTHSDHVAALPLLQTHFPEMVVLAPPDECPVHAQPVTYDQTICQGNLAITPLHTPGHSQGSTSYKIDALQTPVVCVGDAIFAGSVGSIRSHYRQALDTIRSQILDLHPQTIICPGHGPITTVADELANNPFFPAA